MIDTIGYIAGILMSIALLPQVIKTIKTKQVSDLSSGMLIISFIGVLAWLVYGIMISAVPVIVANVVTTIMLGIMNFLKFLYK